MRETALSAPKPASDGGIQEQVVPVDDVGIMGIAENGRHFMPLEAHDLAQVRGAVIGEAHAEGLPFVLHAHQGPFLETARNLAHAAGAAAALVREGGSLLPGGVREVTGNFPKGALVRVEHEGRPLGVGLTNYSAADLRKIMGLKRHEVAAILGNAHYPDVIHRDNLLLDAAV